MNYFKEYPFWDLIVEESYKYENEILKSGSLKKFHEKDAKKNIYIFGCNDACKLFIEKNSSHCNIKGIIDNSKAKNGSIILGKMVYLPENIISKLNPNNDVIIISMRLSADKIADQIDSYGFHNYYGLALLIVGMEPYTSLLNMIEDAKKQSVENIIMFESTNDFDGNSGALYEYLIKNNYGYKYVWILKNNENKKLNCNENTVALCPSYSEEDMKEYIFYRSIVKWQFWDNNPIRKVRREQINVFLQHFGMGYKQVKDIYNSPQYVDYVLVPTPKVYEYVNKALCYGEKTKVIYGELPRNDVLFIRQWNELGKLVSSHFSKVIMWAPTLRDSNLFNRVDSNREYFYGIPLIYEEHEINQLNYFLKEHNMLLIIKIHPRQKHNYRDEFFSNIIYINEENYKQIDSYKLLTQVDAMISDYSSIVFDYMLLDRPIAWVLEDLKNYQIPLLVDDLEKFMPGYRIYELEHLYQFIEDVYENKDLYRNERNKLSDEYNAIPKGRGCKYLAEYFGL